MPRLIPLPTRLGAIVSAIRSMDPVAFQAIKVRDAFLSSDRAQLASELMRRLEADKGLALLADIAPANRLLNWNRIRELAAQHKRFPEACLVGEALYTPEILGPRFHGGAVHAVERVLSAVQQGTAPVPARGLGQETVRLLYHLAVKHSGLLDQLCTKLSPKLFNPGWAAEMYRARMNEDLGLFAATL